MICADDPWLDPIIAACAETGSLALVGAPTQGQSGQPHIAMLAIDAMGATVAYRKMWLGGAEATRFHPGDRPAVIEVDGWRLGLAICKDTGIPQHSAATAALGIDAYLAGVVEMMGDADIMDERAHGIAIHHRVWVAIASFAGPTGGGFSHTAGRSSIMSPSGVVVAQAGAEVGEIATATLA